MRRLSLSLIALLAAGAAQAQTPILVTSAEDSGEGSLRAALEAASASREPARILVLASGDIEITGGLDYTGTAPLEITGQGQTVRAAEDVTLLTASSGASLSIANLAFEGPGGWSAQNRSQTGGAKGIFLDIAEDQEGQVHLILDSVAVRGVSGHGIHVSDCSLADDCGAGAGGAGEGSPASIVADLTGVTIENVGTGGFDRDGLRLDERGEGDIYATIRRSTFTGVGADGVEFDEGGPGHVVVTAYDSDFTDNGNYCDPEVLNTFMPAEPEGEFEQGQMQEVDVPSVSGSPDDACFEREVDTYDDGSVEEYAIALDLDDGFDIDEAGEGSLDILVIGGTVTGNRDEGMDMDEAGPGDLTASYVGTISSGNTDDGYKHSEEDEGSVMGVISGASAMDNGGVGFVYEEEGTGDLDVVMQGVSTSGNDDGETSVELVQEDEGTGTAAITGGDMAGETEMEGVEVSEK